VRFSWRHPVVDEKPQQEIQRAAFVNQVTRAEAEDLREQNWRRFARVSVITEALLHEGAQNHFSQRIESALITSLTQKEGGK
jgi:hypothetical protein